MSQTTPSSQHEGSQTTNPYTSSASRPIRPFKVQLISGEGRLPPSAACSSSTTSDAGSGLHAITASTPDLPILPFNASPLSCRICLGLTAKHRRSDIGSFISALKALQIEWHYVFGWKVDVGGSEEAKITVDGNTYSTLILTLWSNTSLPSNMQIVGAQRYALQRLPSWFTKYFGRREIEDLIKAAVQAAYFAAGVPTIHDPIHNATKSKGTEQQLELEFNETFHHILTQIQEFIQTNNEPKVQEMFTTILPSSEPSENEPSKAKPDTTSSTSSSSTTTTAQPPPIPSAASSLASLAPPTAAIPPAPPLRFDVGQPLFSQLTRGLCACLSLLKKSTGFIHEVAVQRQDEGVMGVHANQRYLIGRLQGCDFTSLYGFMQHKLSPSTSTAIAANGSVLGTEPSKTTAESTHSPTSISTFPTAAAPSATTIASYLERVSDITQFIRRTLS